MECLYIPSPSEKIINLKNVSTILVDTERCKIIYNFVNSINIMERETPDYTYQNFKNLEETLKAYEDLKNAQFIRDNFLISNGAENAGEIVNKNFITSINIDVRQVNRDSRGFRIEKPLRLIAFDVTRPQVPPE